MQWYKAFDQNFSRLPELVEVELMVQYEMVYALPEEEPRLQALDYQPQ
jgi:hypothetical protein